MPPTELNSLLIIFAVAALAPLLCEWVPRLRLPLVVLEIGFGILVGPQVLGWAATGPTIQALSTFGMSCLFFLAGFEIDFKASMLRQRQSVVPAQSVSHGSMRSTA